MKLQRHENLWGRRVTINLVLSLDRAANEASYIWQVALAFHLRRILAVWFSMLACFRISRGSWLRGRFLGLFPREFKSVCLGEGAQECAS